MTAETDYIAAVLAAGPLAYWPMNEPSGTSFADQKGGSSLVSNVALSRITGPFAGTVAPEFNGTSDRASVAVNLSAYPSITLSFWLNWYSFANNDKLAVEYTANYTGANGFIVDPNSTTGGLGQMEFGLHGTAGVNNGFAARVKQSQWAHYSIKFDRDPAFSGNRVEIWRDGGQTGGAKTQTANVGNTWDNSTLYLMSRAGASLFGWGSIAHVAVFPYDFTLNNEQALYGNSPFATKLDFSAFNDKLDQIIAAVTRTYV